MKKIIASALLAVMAVAAFSGCSSKKDQFVVGFDKEFPPMGFVDSDGNYVGFDLEVAEEVANRLDMEFVAQPVDWDSKDLELSSGNIDCIWNGFTMNNREDKYEWTEAYMDNAQVVVVKNDSSINTLADLEGKIVCVQKESSGQAAIEDNAELLASFDELITTDTYLNALMQLDAGAVDAIVMDEIVARYQIQQSGYDFRILDETVSSEEYGVGFLLGNTELRDDVQATLEEMAADGTLAEISTKWFGSDITTISK